MAVPKQSINLLKSLILIRWICRVYLLNGGISHKRCEYISSVSSLLHILMPCQAFQHSPYLCCDAAQFAPSETRRNDELINNQINEEFLVAPITIHFYAYGNNHFFAFVANYQEWKYFNAISAFIFWHAQWAILKELLVGAMSSWLKTDKNAPYDRIPCRLRCHFWLSCEWVAGVMHSFSFQKYPKLDKLVSVSSALVKLQRECHSFMHISWVYYRFGIEMIVFRGVSWCTFRRLSLLVHTQQFPLKCSKQKENKHRYKGFSVTVCYLVVATCIYEGMQSHMVHDNTWCRNKSDASKTTTTTMHLLQAIAIWCAFHELERKCAVTIIISIIGIIIIISAMIVVII